MSTIQQKLIALAVLLAVSFGAGWTINGWRYEASEKQALEKLAASNKTLDEVSREYVRLYNERKAETKIIYREIIKEIPNVTDNRVCFADAAALSLWNQALEGRVSGPAAGTPDKASGTSEVTDREVLENAAENFEQYKQVRDQLNKLIDWHIEKRKVQK